MGLIFVDVEAFGGSPATGRMTEFGAVSYPKQETFHGLIGRSRPDPSNGAKPVPIYMNDIQWDKKEAEVMQEFDAWLKTVCGNERPVFVSDNVAFDWQWVNCLFWKHLGYNPFGHSGRRISDYYAGLVGDWKETQKWKRLRVTKHDHNPVHDALGNVEAFRRIQNGER